jgi:hypothetical protein
MGELVCRRALDLVLYSPIRQGVVVFNGSECVLTWVVFTGSSAGSGSA